VVERISSFGDVGQLAATLRTAAALAIRDGDDEAADALLAAVPSGTHVTVLPVLFQEALEAHRRAARKPAVATANGADALRRVREILAASEPSAPPESDGTARADTGEPVALIGAIRRVGDGWNVGFAGRTVQIRHLKGLEDLATLFTRPDHEIHCLELIGGTDASGDAVAAMDEQARRAYRARIRELQEEIDAARDANDPIPAERAEAELEALVKELSASFGLSGRPRASGSAVERARSAVTWRIRAAVKRLGDVHPELGRHLQNAIRTGTWCSYRPETSVEWRIEREP
jgi:hypothetical protein